MKGNDVNSNAYKKHGESSFETLKVGDSLIFRGNVDRIECNVVPTIVIDQMTGFSGEKPRFDCDLFGKDLIQGKTSQYWDKIDIGIIDDWSVDNGTLLESKSINNKTHFGNTEIVMDLKKNTECRTWMRKDYVPGKENEYPPRPGRVESFSCYDPSSRDRYEDLHRLEKEGKDFFIKQLKQ